MPSSINVMEAIWQTSDKADDGSLYYPIEFIDFLWDNGFVDTKQFPKELWRIAFAPFKQADGNYKLTHDEFLTLDKYRYRGEIRIPFNPMRINEGKYTDEGFDQLARDSIEPSCSLTAAELKKAIDDLKKEFRQSDGLVLIKATAKLKIKKLLEEKPSPMRRLEILFDQLLEKKGIEKEIEAGAQKLSQVATPEQQATLQQSTFTTGALSFAEVQAKKLKEVTKAQAAKVDPAPDAGGEELQKVKRSKKGLRG